MAVITKAEFESRFSDDEIVGIRDYSTRHITLMNWMYLYDEAESVDTDSAVVQFVLSVLIDEGVLSESSIPEILA